MPHALQLATLFFNATVTQSTASTTEGCTYADALQLFDGFFTNSSGNPLAMFPFSPE